MGQELECNLRYRGKISSGKAWLETDYLLFRGDERLKLLFKDLKAVTATSGNLKLDFDGGPAELELGQAAEKWAHKILHPPTRASKLGIKPDMRYRTAGRFDDSFLDELRTGGAAEVSAKAKADLVFLAAPTAKELSKISRLAETLNPDGALWIVYPKGVTEIREIDVLHAGRAAGLKDVKVASFSSTHTALKFVIPVALRRA